MTAIQNIRLIARTIGIAEMVFNAVTAVFLGVIFIYLTFLNERLIEKLTTYALEEGIIFNKYSHSTIIKMLWLGFTLVSLLLAVDTYASWNLIKATEKEVDSNEGVRRCIIWRGIKFFFLVLTVLNCKTWFSGKATSEEIIFDLVLISFYLVELGFVHQYIKHLKYRLPAYERTL